MLLKAFKTRVIRSVLTSNKYLLKKRYYSHNSAQPIYIDWTYLTRRQCCSQNRYNVVGILGIFFPAGQLICKETSRAF